MADAHPDRSTMVAERRRTVLVVALVGLILGCWLLLVPPGGQPDEHSHLVRSAALVGDLSLLGGGSDDGTHEIADRFLVPDPGCYAFDPTLPASCAVPVSPTGADVVQTTRADGYPPGAHLVFGLAGSLPGLAAVWWGRLAAAAVATVLVGTGLAVASRTSALLGGAVLLGITPMAWSIMPAVNPSAFAIAGAVALWVGWATVDVTSRPTAAFSPASGWLIAAGWAALAITRRDGLVWATVITAVAAVLLEVRLVDARRALGNVRTGVIGLATLIAVVWGLTSDSSTSRLVVVAPVALVAVEAVRAWIARRRPLDGWSGRSVLAPALAGVVLAAIAWVVLVSTRPGGWSTELTIAVIGQTDENLIEAIGVLGWLDTVVPRPVVWAWVFVVGAMAYGAAAVRRRGMWAAIALAVVAVVSSWTFELLQGNTTGTYWQGRYSLPLVIGIPVCLAIGRRQAMSPLFDRRLARWSAWTGLAAIDVAAWAAARRWGVGTTGSHLPWKWDTAIQPVPPLLPLVAMAAATLVLGLVLLGPEPARR